jgi:hypothetical protein
MSNEPEGADTSADDDAGGALSTLGDTIGDLVTGIPAPMRKNAFKAFGRLCTAAVEYPVALLEGKAAEKRAETRARVKLINASAKQIAQQMQIDPEYARAAAAKFAQKIVRERANLDQISEFAAQVLKSEPPPSPSNSEGEAPSISDDWLNAFENAAAQMSSGQMQRLFGRILAGEIHRPASYSVKTIRLMAQLDNQAAALFRLACSVSISIRIPMINQITDARVVSMGSAGANSLQAYGLNFDALNVLQEYGLIISDYNSYVDYQMAVAHEQKVLLPIIYQNVQWGLVPKIPAATRQEFKIHGVALSRSGKELLPIIDTQPNEAYTEALRRFFEEQGVVMTRLG